MEMESILLLQLQNPGDILLREEHAGQEVLPIPLSWLCLQRHMEIRTKYFLSVEIGMDTNTTGWYKSILDVTAYMQKKIWECSHEDEVIFYREDQMTINYICEFAV